MEGFNLNSQELLQEIRKIVAEEVGKRMPYYFLQVEDNIAPCLHDNCTGCRNGTCSGAHFLHCSCPRCDPRC